MSALTSLLVRDEVVTVRQIEDALQRQVLEGGELDTALLELDAANENALNAYRAASFRLPSVARDEVMSVTEATLSLVPADLARRFRVVPITHDATTLLVAAVNPLVEPALVELSGALGMRVECCIASEVRIEAALAEFYGAALSPRMLRLLGRVGSLSAGKLPVVEPIQETPMTGLSHMFDEDSEEEDNTDRVVRPSDVTVGKVISVRAPPPSDHPVRNVRIRRAEQSTQPMPVNRGPSPEALAPPVAAAVAVTPAQARPATPPPPAANPRSTPPSAAKRRSSPARPMRAPTRRPRPVVVPQGPLSRELASRLLSEAGERDVVVEVFFRYVRQYFDATALLSVRDDRLIGREIHNVPNLTDIGNLTVTLGRGSVLDELTRTLQLRVGDLARKELDAPLANALLRADAQPSALVPIVIQRRMVAVIYGDRNGEFFKPTDLAPVTELLPEVSLAFERIIRTRKVLGIQAGAAANNNARAELGRAATQLDIEAVTPDKVRETEAPREPAQRESAHPRELAQRESARTRETEVQPELTAQHRDAEARRAMLERRDSNMPRREAVDPMEAEALLQRARRALTELGAPRTAPPPPGAAARVTSNFEPRAPRPRTDEVIEVDRMSTAPLPVFTGEPQALPPPTAALDPDPSSRGAGYFSKPPPGAGRYSSVREGEGDETSTEAQSDTARMRGLRSNRPREDTPGAIAAEPAADSRPSVRPSKPPPGTGSYRSHEVFHEVVTLAPDSASANGALTRPAPAGPSEEPDNHPTQRPREALPPSAAEIARSLLPPAAPEAHQAAARPRSLLPPPDDVRRPRPLAPAEEWRQARSALPSSDDPHRRSRSNVPPASARHDHHRRSSRRPPAPDRRRETPTASPLPEFAPLPKSLGDPMSSRPPPPVVEPSARAKGLVDELCTCGPDDEGPTVAALVALGADALTPLVERFPGPLWFDRRRPYSRLPFGRDTSPIARALAAFGDSALPRLAPLLRAGSADVRYYATLFVSDQVHPELLGPITERLFDDDPQIRLMVRDALPLYRHLPAFAEVLSGVRARALEAAAALPARLAAIDALTMLRDAASVPCMVELLAHADRQLSVPAHRALVTITCQDFGSSTRKWRNWYEDNREFNRVQWLIESLMHSEQNLRSAAGIELQKVTHVYYGYVATAPKRDRERARKRYEQWWMHEGVKQFR